MKEKKVFFFHPGWPKTATKSIQFGIFQKLISFNCYLRKDVSMHPYYGHKLLRPFLYNSKKINLGLIKREIFKNLDINKKTIYSDEVFLTILLNNKIKKKYNLNLNQIIKKTKKIIPRPYFIFTIRNQEEYLKSWYNQTSYKNKKFSREDFLKSINKSFKNKGPIDLEMLDYYKVIKTYKKYFPKSKIKILLFEDFTNNYNFFKKKIISILNISKKDFSNFKKLKINTSSDRKSHKFYRLYANFRTHFFPNFQFSRFFGVKKRILTDTPLEKYYGPVEKITIFMDNFFQGNKVKNIDTKIPKDIKMKIKTRFSTSNKKLDSEFKLSLKKYNYFFSKEH